jgi:hypothetical protein
VSKFFLTWLALSKERKSQCEGKKQNWERGTEGDVGGHDHNLSPALHLVQQALNESGNIVFARLGISRVAQLK